MVDKKLGLQFDLGYKENTGSREGTEQNQGNRYDPNGSVADPGSKSIDTSCLNIGEDKGQEYKEEEGSQQIN